MEKLGAMDGALRGMAASRPWGVASLTLATALLPWIIAFTPPLLRSLQVGFATDAWRLLVGWLTTPVLFLLLNFVIISIWATSASNSGQSRESPVEASAGVLGTGDITKRKETIIVLPPVSPVKSSNIQASVFTRSPPPMNLVEEPAEEEILTARESLTLSDDSEEKEMKISPPPPPSFLVEQQEQLRKQKQMQRRNSDTGVKSSNTSKPKTRRTLSERSGRIRSSSISFGGGVPDHQQPEEVAESTDELRMRFESVIANFHAQLRLQTRSE